MECENFKSLASVLYFFDPKGGRQALNQNDTYRYYSSQQFVQMQLMNGDYF